MSVNLDPRPGDPFPLTTHLLQKITELERENAALRERLEILSKLNETQTDEYICVDRYHQLWKRAALDAARKEQG